MNTTLFRRKNLERVSSPEQLGDYLRVTSPSVWIVLAAVAALLAGLLIWSSVTAVESYAAGTAEVRGGVLTMRFDDPEAGEKVEAGMNIRVGDTVVPVTGTGRDAAGEPIAVAEADLPDGSYEARAGYRTTRIIRMLFS